MSDLELGVGTIAVQCSVCRERFTVEAHAIHRVGRHGARRCLSEVELRREGFERAFGVWKAPGRTTRPVPDFQRSAATTPQERVNDSTRALSTIERANEPTSS
jgi:hypothetical protein